MFVGSVHITVEQIEAGIRAMTGTFRMMDVRGALSRAGVPWSAAYRAADRLLQAERKAGRIRVNPTNKREWIAA